MAQSAIPVDLFNPGQVFACMGFLETAEILLGGARGGFQWQGATDTFILSADTEQDPVHTVLAFLAEAEVIWLSPSEALQERDGGPTCVIPGISSSREPKSPDLEGLLRVTSKGMPCEVRLGFWADGSNRFSTTFKKSTNGASSHVRVSNALDAIRTLDLKTASCDPFNQAVRTESLFRLDPRGMVDPIHGGFSPDTLRKGETGGLDVRVSTYPICELLAVIGLHNTRPETIDSSNFAYHVWNILLPPILARPALGGKIEICQLRRFIVEHDEVKKGGDRKIMFVREDNL